MMSAFYRCADWPEKRMVDRSIFDSSRGHFIFTLFPTMPLSVSDRVKSNAVLYYQGTEDENGLTFSQRQLGKGLGTCCYEN